MMENVQNIFYAAQQKITDDLGLIFVDNRLHGIQLKIMPSQAIALSLRQEYYRRASLIPAYYDPNARTIYLNSSALKRMSETTIFVICYHELVHAVSLHLNYQLIDTNVFQSGVKFERYAGNRYFCYNRLLNEGIVQFITTFYNQLDFLQYGYAREVAIVHKLCQSLGIAVVNNAILYEQYSQFKLRFEQHYGIESFSWFTKLLDKKQYDSIDHMLDSHTRPRTLQLAQAVV